MKKHSFLSFFVFSFSILHAQKNPAFEGIVIPTSYDKLGAIKGIAGIIDDNIYVIENDFGGKFDMNNNIKTSIAIVSLQKGNLVKRVFLNDMVAQSGKVVNKILFCDVVAWKDQLFGFYTYKHPGGKEFPANAIILNANGELVTANQEIGEFKHEDVEGSFLWQGNGHLGGRNTLSVVKDFQYRFTNDSSRLVVLCAGEKTANVHFKIYKPGLIHDKEVMANVPAEKNTSLLQFTMDNAGVIYLVTQTLKSKAERKSSSGDDYLYMLHTINTAQNNKVQSKDFELNEKAILNINIGITEKGTPILAGYYNDLTHKKREGQAHGSFTVRFEPATLNYNVQANEIPVSVLLETRFKKDIENGIGLEDPIAFVRFETKPGGGLYGFGQSNTGVVTVRGTTGAMNSYDEMTWYHTVCSIDESGKILWESFTFLFSGNKEMATRKSRIEFAPVGDQVHGLFVRQGLTTMEDYISTANGLSIDRSIKLSADMSNYGMVEGTLRRIGADEYAAIGFAEKGKQASIRVIKVRL